MKGNLIIGVDLGGTKIAVAVVSHEGNVIGPLYTAPTLGNESKDVVLRGIFDAIDHIIIENDLDKADISGIGIGSTGPIDVREGTILDCPQLPTLNHFPLRKSTEEKFGLPVVLNNDANAMILGESIFGAGKGYPVVLGFTLGTGIGCALVINRQIYLGATETSGEIWVSPYRSGTIEDYVSGRGISRIYRELSGEEKNAVEIANLAQKGDLPAKRSWDEFGQALAFAMSWCVNLIDPDIVVLGGSITKSFDLFYPAMDLNFRKYICPRPAQTTKVVPSSLGDNAGVIGAASLIISLKE
jgi:glucokinase